ncbi:Thioredoxin reductase [Minicystis rosea]|nr:Thioredoxin reductase [Minicystis rosea]
MTYDVVIAGGGPAGLSAALVLGRARKRVLLCDAGPPRNAAAEQIHGFVTRDGTPPAEFRRIARAELAPYDSVEIRDVRVERFDGERGSFRVHLEGGVVEARRVLLTVGMIDEIPDLPGYRELWGKSIAQCPYCHAWEVRDRRFGSIIPAAVWAEFPLFLKGWTNDVVVFTDGRFEVPEDMRARLSKAGIPIEERPIRAILPTPDGHHLSAVELADGAQVPCDMLFARPPQRQTDLVMRAELALDEQGFVRVDDFKQTSRPGVYAAGDLTTMMQGALVGAAAGAQAAYRMNHELTLEHV